MFELLAKLHPDDVKPDASGDDLRAFRDTALAMLAMTAAVPVIPLMRGTFTFPLGGGKFQQKSLGPMTMKGRSVGLQSVAPLATGMAASEGVQTAAFFLWQALNADLPLYRFMNLAVCAQVIANEESAAARSVHPMCGNANCRAELKACPECGKEWRIPNTLRNHLRSIIADEGMIAEFTELRNTVFHGSPTSVRGDILARIEAINKPLLVALRNILGGKFGLTPIHLKDVPLSGHDLQLMMSVFYTMPDGEVGTPPPPT